LVGKYRGLKLPGSEGGVGCRELVVGSCWRLWEVVRLKIYLVKDSIRFSIIDSIN